MELNLYEINEFNKEMKKLNDSLNNEDNNKILEYAQNRKKKLNEELKEINVEQIKNNGNLTAQEWLKKDFVEKEINKHEETISKIETERENNKKVILEKNLQKEDMKRQLKLQEAQIEIELADIQKIWNEAITELNSNNEQIKQLTLANRNLLEFSIERVENSNEILKLQNKNDELKEVMKENVITSKKGIEIRNKQEDIKAMINILDSGYILENVKNPNETEKPEETKPEETKSEPKKSEPTKPEPVKPEPKKVEPVKPEQVKVEPTKPEPVKPKTTNIKPVTSLSTDRKKIVSPKIEINAKDGTIMRYDEYGDAEEKRGLNYPKKYWKEGHTYEVLKKYCEENNINVQKIAKRIDPNIINYLEIYPNELNNYIKSVNNGKLENLGISYNLHEMYDTDLLTNKEKRYIAKCAKKAGTIGAKVENDSLKDRALGWIKSHLNPDTRNKAVEEKKKEMLSNGRYRYASKEAEDIMNFQGTKEEFIDFCVQLKESGKDMNELKSVIYAKQKLYNIEKHEENTNNKKNKFKESLKVGKNSLSKVHHYTSEKLNKSKLLNNIKMHGEIATRKITGYLKGENSYKVQKDVKNIKEDYMSR